MIYQTEREAEQYRRGVIEAYHMVAEELRDASRFTSNPHEARALRRACTYYTARYRSLRRQLP